MKFLLALLLFLNLDLAYATDTSVSDTISPSAAVAAIASPAEPAPVTVTHVESEVVTKTGSFVDKIPVTVPAWILAVLAFVAELAMRFYPTAKPKSWLLLVASMFALIGTGFTKLSSLFDKVGQNLKDPVVK